MSIINDIINCSTKEEIDKIVEERINELNNSKEPIEQIGFKSALPTDYDPMYKGFIPLNTRVKYENASVETYSMNTTDFFYEFAHWIKDYNLDSITKIVQMIQTYSNNYFGIYQEHSRDEIFFNKAYQSTTTDDELFKALENNKLGDLKGLNAAMCTERSALAQQLLSFCGLESYYCIGKVQLGGKQEDHCFNIVKRDKDYALLDYSIPEKVYSEDEQINSYLPFVGILTNEEFEQYQQTGDIKSFPDHYYQNGKRIETGEMRDYLIGKPEKNKTL